tara:strand:- start:3848 stop:4306 length:459 start_codon:yes stop_codon:yes gene_type:complete
MSKKKEHINTITKQEVWDKYKHPAQPDIAQCVTCYCLVGRPQSLGGCKNTKLEGYYGTGEFGHIIAEANGGSVESNNLVIQCKPCNLKTGTNTLTVPTDNPDQYMPCLTDNLFDNSMLIETTQCHAITTRGIRCVNPPTPDHEYCYIHLAKH